MGEYEKEPKKQLSKAINHSKANKSQLKQFVDNRNSISKYQTIIKTIQNFKVPIQCFTKEDVSYRAQIISQRPERNGKTNEENWYQAEKELIAEEIYENKIAGGYGDDREQNWNNAVVIHNFRGKEYKKDDYNLGYGHFDAKYVPYSKDLNISLPVFFDASFDKKEAIFIDNVKNTWSNKFSIECNPGAKHDKQSNFDDYTKKVWNTTLSPVNVNVKAEKESDRNKAYFKIQRNSNRSSVANDGTVKFRNGALGLDPDPRLNDDLTKRNTIGHETGHMFGLDDEYEATAKGYHTDHYNLTQKAFGQPYADDHAVQDDNKYIASIMNEGTQVQKHHYVTFWDAMVQAIQAQDPIVPSPDSPNDHSDWQIV